eukprot:g16121.t1
MLLCCCCQPGQCVSVLQTEQIKRVNRLYTNDSIFLKECLRIPIPKQGPLQNGSTVPDGAPGQSEPALDPLSPELSPMEFLKRLDSKITQSKAGAIRKLSDGAGRFELAAIPLQTRGRIRAQTFTNLWD